MAQKESQLATLLPAANHPFNWTGLDPAQMKSVAQAMAISGMFPDIQADSAKAFVKIMAGQEMGIPPFQAMSDISIIQGKAAAGGNIHAAKVKSNPKYDYEVKSWTTKGCAIEFFELKGGQWKSLGTSQFDETDATRAGLLGKGNWKTYPRNMYFNRAMTAGVRTYCPDALNGVNAYTPEELGAEVDEDGRAVVGSTASFPQDEPVKIDEAPVENSDQANVDAVFNRPDDLPLDTQTKEVYSVPDFPAGEAGKIVHPLMTKQINDWRDKLGWDETKFATFAKSVIGNTEPVNRNEALVLLEALRDELNEAAARQEKA